MKLVFADSSGLYAVTQSIIYEWDESDSWISIDSVYFKPVDDFNMVETSAPSYINTLATDGRHLFAGDHECIPMVYIWATTELLMKVNPKAGV